MKTYLYFENLRYEENKLKIEKGKIIIEHKGFINSIYTNQSNLTEICDGFKHNRTYLKELLEINNAYCPELLKNKLKYLRGKYAYEENEKVFDKFYVEFENNWKNYLYIYTADEILKIILDFGKRMLRKTKLLDYTFTDDHIYNINTMINRLSEEKRWDIERIIISFINKIGVPVEIINNCSIWNEFIYDSILLYYISNNNNDVILNYLNNKYRNIEDIESERLIKMDTNSKIVYDVKSILSFVYNYVVNDKFNDKEISKEELEDYRKYLLNKSSTKEKKKKITNYSYNDLLKSYMRHKLKY